VLHPFEKKQPSKGTVVLEYPPTALLVKFDGAEWVLGDLDPGVYPVKVQKKDWYVDSDSPKPKIKVTREQVGIGPDYARTAYSTQGLTLDAALVDLCFSDETNPTTAYVALSRVRGADDVLIIQDFDIEPFQQGIPVGPKWLLKTLRREDLSADIAAYDDALIAQREAEVIARDAVKATNGSKLKAKKKISNKGRVRTAEQNAAKRLRESTDEQKAAKRLRQSTDEQKAAKRLRDSKRVRTDEQKAAERLRQSTDEQKAAKRLHDSKRVRTDEQKAAERLRQSTDEQKAAKRLRDSKRVRTDEQKAAKRLRDRKQKAAKRV
jgi:hypothetical protein